MQQPVKTPYDDYVTDPTPENLRKTVDFLRPTISYALTQMGGHENPTMRAKADVLAAKAVQSYKPDLGASLATWTSQQLQELRRIRRQTEHPLRLPERAQLDAWTLQRSSLEFHDKHGRDPDLLELSDLTQMPVSRIKKVQTMNRPVPSASAFADIQNSFPDHTPEALDYLYKDSDAVDRQIMEMKLGIGGRYSTPVDNMTVAAKLKLHPAQVTRRSARLLYRLQQMEAAIRDL